MVEVIGLDIRDDRDPRRQREEGPIALVGLDDEHIPAADMCIGPRLVQFAADDEGRIGAAALQGDGEHRGCGRLAVRTGDGDTGVPAHDLGERLGPRQLGYPMLTGVGAFAVRGRYSRGDDQRVRVYSIEVTDVGVDTEHPQRLHPARILGIGSGHRDALRGEHAGDSRHARATDTDDVHATEGIGQLLGHVPSLVCSRVRSCSVVH